MKFGVLQKEDLIFGCFQTNYQYIIVVKVNFLHFKKRFLYI